LYERFDKPIYRGNLTNDFRSPALFQLRTRAFSIAFTRLEEHTFLPVRKAVDLQKIPLNHSNGLQMAG
ncbi:hypothetical protein, partial [Bacillus licheniformis]|uniref:hypothetical protein n=1 Tax=Bacillus licheniformis TaxID=1402 RepID=UPI001F583B9B